MIGRIRAKKYDPRRQENNEAVVVRPEMRPVILKDLAATFDEVLKKYGVAKVDDNTKLLPTNRGSVRSPSKAASAASSVYRGKR